MHGDDNDDGDDGIGMRQCKSSFLLGKKLF